MGPPNFGVKLMLNINIFILLLSIYIRLSIYILLTRLMFIYVCIYIQSTPLNRVTSVRGHFDPIKRRTASHRKLIFGMRESFDYGSTKF